MVKYFVLSLLIMTLISCGLEEIKTTHPNGTTKEQYTINKNGGKEGEYKAFSETGKLKEKAFYKNDALNGIRTLYYDNGNAEIEENYIDGGILHGTYKSYYEGGQLQLEKQYENNVLTGLVKVYYQNGKIKEEVTMHNNNENGPFTEYYENGQIHWKGTYLNGDNEYGLLEEWDSLGAPIKRMKCDSLAICRTFWKPGMPEVNYDTLKTLPNLSISQ
jgi:antitoxin component YwqK of YwqJK toxin-antitoxin module